MFLSNILPGAAAPFLRAASVLNVWENGHDGYSYEFSRQSMPIKPGEIVTISLKKTTLNNGFSAQIISYLCTDKSKAPVTDVAPRPPSQSGPWPPKHPYPAGTNQIEFTVTLDEHELIFIGVIVRITDPKGIEQPFDLICDPQVGNGPP